ncbi:MAG TPA: ankyrin repeat domain-containing protein [Candidatus Paceibacterota bacterium]
MKRILFFILSFFSFCALVLPFSFSLTAVLPRELLQSAGPLSFLILPILLSPIFLLVRWSGDYALKKLAPAQNIYAKFLYDIVIFTKWFLLVFGLLLLAALVLTAGFIFFAWWGLLYHGHVVWVIGVAVVLVHASFKYQPATALVTPSLAPSSNWKKLIRTIPLILVAFLSLFIWSSQWIVVSKVLARSTGNEAFCYLPSLRVSEDTLHSWLRVCLPQSNYAAYAEKEKDCSAYTLDTHMYASCKLGQYQKEGIYGTEPISCENMYVYGDSCRGLQVTQRALQAKDPAICDEIAPTTGTPSGRYALCVGHFPNSPQWSKGCNQIQSLISSNGSVGGNMSDMLITGRCLTTQNADLSLSGSGKGKDPFDRYGVAYKEHYRTLNRTDFYSPRSPAWFEKLRSWTKKDYDYLTSIGADPNAVDDFGRTALILEIQDRLYLNDYLIHNFDDLPKEQQTAAAEEAVQTMKLLIEFGTDPKKEDILHLSALDYASQIRNDVFREKALEVLSGNSATDGWSRFDKSSYGFSLEYPDSLVSNNPEKDSEGTTWISFSNREAHSSTALSVIIGTTNTPLNSSSQTPIYDSCLKGKHWLGYSGENIELKHSKFTNADTSVEHLKEFSGRSLVAELLAARSGDTCYILRITDLDFLKETETIDRIFESFVLTL